LISEDPRSHRLSGNIWDFSQIFLMSHGSFKNDI
jgi:hypothetical protein